MLENVAVKIQDFFYVAVGNYAQVVFTSLDQNSLTKATLPLEWFIYIAPSSLLFPPLAVTVRDRLRPIFHTWLLGLGGREINTAKLIGRSKTVVIDGK